MNEYEVTNTKVQERAAKFLRVVQEAQNMTETLPLSIPGPIRDFAFHNLVQILMEEPHKASRCHQCLLFSNVVFSNVGGIEIIKNQRNTEEVTASGRTTVSTGELLRILAEIDKIYDGQE